MAEENSKVLDKYVAEFIGTFLLVLTVVCNVNGGHMYAALSIACVLMVGVYSLGAVSGAHFNPAVTIAITLADKMEGGWIRAVIYIISQMIGGILGAVVGFAVYRKTFMVEPQADFGGSHACLVEFCYTFMLCFVVLNCACAKDTQPNQYYGLAIGFVILAGGYAAGPVSGGALNPAVALGIDIANLMYTQVFGWSCWYLVYQLLGGGIAVLLFRVVRPSEFGDQLSGSTNSLSQYVSEFLGTFFLVLSVGLNVLPKNDSAALSIAATLMCFIYSLGDVSGAHFNPAVTLAILISGREKITPIDSVIYIVVQLLGGIAAGLLYFAVYGETFPLGPGHGHGWGAVAAAEIIFTGVLCFVVLATATLKEENNPGKDIFGLAIGMCVTVGGFAIGSVSGGSLNPAVSVGIDTAHAIAAHASWNNCIGYLVFELIGAACAAGLFYITHQKKEYGDSGASYTKVKNTQSDNYRPPAQAPKRSSHGGSPGRVPKSLEQS